MKKYWFYGGLSILLLLVVAACTSVQKPVEQDSAGRPIGDPTGRVYNPDLSCAGYCSGYAAEGDGWCFCDAPCEKNANCCSDFKTACPDTAAGKPSIAEERVLNPTLSCAGHCTGYAESGNDWCFCDAVCPENGNCCSDFETACPKLAG